MRTHPSFHAVLAVALAGALTGCGGQDEPEAPAGRSLGHVHGLDVDPADGALYVAAHQGLFKIKSSTEAELAGGHVQDTMGFTITEPRTFLASGHPAPQNVKQGKGPHLGLISSVDGGVTWTTVSEEGKADFHAIQPAGETLYVYDSQTGRLRSSTDGGARWTSRAELQVIDLAAGADDPKRVYATTPEGVQVSKDGGESFERLAGAPLLSHLDLVGDGLLTGVDASGVVRMSRDGGATWRQAGGSGSPATAFTAVDANRLLVASENGTVRQSHDGGRTFHIAYRPAAEGS